MTEVCLSGIANAMKIAISIQDSIFKEVEATAKELHCSRSELFSLAVKEFLEKVKSRKLLKDLNDAYSEAESGAEAEVRKADAKRYAESISKERY